MANRNHRNNAAAVDVAARLFRRARDDVSSALRVVAIATCVMAARAAVSRPAVSDVLAYPPALAVSLIGGLSTMWAAVWVAGDPARRRAAGLIVFCASLFLMAMAVRLTNDLQYFLDILGAIA